MNVLKRSTVKRLSVFRFLSSRSFEWKSALCGIESAATPPSSWYTDPTFLHHVEQRQTFRQWLLVCNSHQVKNDGDYFATTINNQPIVIVNSQGTLKAFYNVCRHHAAQICDNGEGKLGTNGRFSCPYHGWQYNADGRLVKAMHMKGCKDFSPKNFNLNPILLDRLGPWVYIKLGSAPLVPSTADSTETSTAASTSLLLEDCPDLATMHGMLSKTDHEGLVPVRYRSYHLKCNWKVFVDNYLDGGYHVPVAHPGLSADLELASYTRKGFDSFYLQSCPAKTETMECGGDNTDKKAAVDGASSRISGGAEHSEALYVFQYPNIMINRYGQWMDTNIVWPRGVNECVVDFVWYAHPDLALTPSVIEDGIAASDQVQQEDVWLCERVQNGLQSDGYDTGRYAPALEGGEYMFHQKLYKDYQASELSKTEDKV